MAAGQQDRAKQLRHRKARRRRRRAAISAQSWFVPLLGLWGAALGALPVLVIPAELVALAGRGTGLVILGGLAQPLLAGLSALALGGGLWLLAAGMHRRARRSLDMPSLASLATRRIRPIDPARDLGSRRLDDPVDDASCAMPKDAPAAVADAEEVDTARAAEPAAPPPRALDLAEFAELPGRNAVWVEEPAPAAAAAAADPAPQPAVEARRSAAVTALRNPVPPPVPGSAALSRLRAVPPHELSLVEMTERFAGALHEHRAKLPTQGLTSAELAAREAALAEALKALAALSDGGAAGGAAGGAPAGSPPQGEPLRAALARLQGQRGAA